MALTKTPDHFSDRDVVKFVLPQGSRVREIPMGISLEGTAHILDRLTEIYPRPIEATVREIVSNAYDATALIDSSLRRPIEITTPTLMNTAFIVRDFGVGMDLATVQEKYSQYGVSSKAKDMTQVGAYGLGAKAPLAYCSEFIVRTVKDGSATEFIMSRGATGSVVKIADPVVTDEANGTTVTIPAKLEDGDNFKQALQTYRRHSFDVKVIIDGQDADSSEYVLVKDDFELYSDGEVRSCGRVWLNRKSLAKWINAKIDGSPLRIAYVLSGWAYGSPYNQRYQSNRNEFDALVELKPGVVDFPSSRDDITQNVRASNLNARVTAFLNAGAESGVKALLESYRNFDDEAATAIFQALFLHGMVKEGKLYLPSGKVEAIKNQFSIGVTAKQLTTRGGYSPLAPFNETPNVHDFIALDGAGKKIYGLTDSATLMARPGEMLTGLPLSAARARFAHTLNSDAVFSAAGLFSLLRIANQEKTQKMVVVFNADARQARQILSLRQVLIQTGYGKAWLGFVAGNFSSKGLRLLSKIAETYGGEFEIIEAKRFVAKLVEAKPEPEPIPGAQDKFFAHRVRTTPESNKELALSLQAYNWDTSTTTVADIRNENAYLFFVSSLTEALGLGIGVANAGHSFANQDVYLVVGPQMLRAVQFKALEGYSSIAASKSFSLRSAAARKLLTDRTFYGRNLLSELKKSELTPIVRSYLNEFYVCDDFLRLLTQKFEEIHGDGVRNEIIAAWQGRGNTRLLSLSEYEMRQALPDERGDFLAQLHREMKKIRAEKNFEDLIINALVTYRGSLDDKDAEIYLERFCRRF